MIIGVAGRYSADTEKEKQVNLEILNAAAKQLLLRGHTPIVGVNAALPIVINLEKQEAYKAMLDISLALINSCEAILLLSESPGAIRERDLRVSKGLPVYYSIEEIPQL